jgi:nicotinamidase/pyrazinamidase
MNRKVHLITIDPQNDFCIPLAPGADPKTARAGFEKGALVVAGADADMDRLSKFITKNKKRLEQIHCTLDSHQWVHIAHPAFWVNSKGERPDPFTMISEDDVKNGVWRAYNPNWQKRALAYVEALKKNGRYVLVVWPPHCLIGTWGHMIVPSVAAALYEWEADFNRINFVAKGSNLFTEHYSGVQADVPDDEDASTKMNTNLIEVLTEADEILITGEALSHCVANTIRDVAKEFGDAQVQKFTLLEDTSSNVGTFEKMGQDFVKEMVKKGMKITNTRDW